MQLVGLAVGIDELELSKDVKYLFTQSKAEQGREQEPSIVNR